MSWYNNGFSTLQSDKFEHKCLSFKPQDMDLKVELVQYIPQGASATLSYRDVTCGGPGQSPIVSQNICRVAMHMKTSDRSGIHFEVWLPERWEDRFLATGNGGLNGCKGL